MGRKREVGGGGTPWPGRQEPGSTHTDLHTDVHARHAYSHPSRKIGLYYLEGLTYMSPSSSPTDSPTAFSSRPQSSSRATRHKSSFRALHTLQHITLASFTTQTPHASLPPDRIDSTSHRAHPRDPNRSPERMFEALFNFNEDGGISLRLVMIQGFQMRPLCGKRSE